MRPQAEILERLKNPVRASRVLERILPGLAQRELRVRSLQILDLSDRRDVSIRYALELETSSGELETRELTALYLTNGGWRKTAYRLDSLLSQCDARDPLCSRLSAREESLGLFLFPFPVDPKLPQLARVTDPSGWFRTVLAAHLEGFSGADGEFQVQVLRYVPTRRCQLRFSFRVPGGPEVRVLGKVFRDERGRYLTDRMRDVEMVFRRCPLDELQAVKCHGYLPEWKMVLQEWVEGETLYGLLHSGRWEEGLVEKAGQSIAVLHSHPVPVPGEHTLLDEMRIVRNAWLRLSRQTQRRFAALWGALQADLTTARSLEPVVLHRDFYDKQLLVNGQYTTLIDLDTVARGPAELDVANFQSHLILRSLQGVLPEEDCKRLSHAFLGAYQRATGRPLNSGLLRTLRAATLVRLASKYGLLPQQGDLSWRLLESAAEMLVMAARVECSVGREVL